MAVARPPGNRPINAKRRLANPAVPSEPALASVFGVGDARPVSALRVGGWTVLAIACAATLAACGSGGSSGGTTTGPGTAAGLRFAQCMRARGVPDFPDPMPSGGFPRGSGDAQSPAFRTAHKGCTYILKAGAYRPSPTVADRVAPIRFARCMRAHRVPNFPDPVTPSEVPRNTDVLMQGGMMFPVGSTVDTRSPAFQQAATACGPTPARGHPKGG